MKILFLTEFGEGYGYGHLNRCLALADGFSEFGCEITFLNQASSGAVPAERDYRFLEQKWDEPEFLKKTLPDFDITVTDSYRAPEDILEYIGKNANAPVYLVDSTLKFYPAGTILFPSVYADNFDLDEYSQLEVFKGIEYLLFTREFWDIKKAKPAKRIKQVGISLGGIANDSVVSILSTLHEYLAGAGEISIFGELDNDIKRKVPLDKCNLTGFLQKEQYVKEIAEMDIMICNGGQTLNECLLLGIPAISLICAENQKKNTVAWEQLGLTVAMDVRNEWKELEFQEKLQSITPHPKRKEINNKCRSMLDHKGAIRAAKKILKITTG